MAATEIIIIGGGIVGLAVARRLAEDARRILLLERHACGAEASWAGAGVLSPANPHRKDPAARLQAMSLRLYPAFCQQLHDETGIDPEYDHCTELTLAFNERALQSAREDLEAAAGRTMPDGRPAYVLHDPEETARLEPAAGRDILGALECRQTARVRNPRLLQALKASCLKRGVDIREGTPVLDLLTQGDRVTGVQTPQGPIESETVILCAGAWSSQIASRLEHLMPVHPVRGQMVLMKLDKPPFRPIISRGKTYLVPRRDGHVLLGSTEEPEAGFTKRNTPAAIAKLMQRALQMAPVIAAAPVEATWSGLRPGTPDDRPYIGPVPTLKGLIAATGHFRTGLTNAPATAEALTATLQNHPFEIDLTPCHPGRGL